MPPGALPDKPTVLRDVTNLVAAFTGMAPASVRPTYELKKAPLRFDDGGLRWLAMSLRGYVQRYNQGETVRSSETRASKLTVSGLGDLCHTKIHA